MNAVHCLGAALIVATSLCSQQQLMMQFGTVLTGGTGNRVAAAGDMDGDLVPDLLVASSNIGAGRVEIVSGATGTKRFINNSGGGSFSQALMFASDDMNLDGVPDVVMQHGAGLAAYSGADESLLWQSSLNIINAAAAGDLNGDMRGDLVAMVVIGGDANLWTLRGIDGSVLTVGPTFSSAWPQMTFLGDVNGGNGPEVAVRNNGTQVYSLANMALGVTIAVSPTNLFAADVTGNGRNEIMVDSSGNILGAYDALTGSLVRTFVSGWDDRAAVLGDLTGDGADELAIRRNGDVEVVSGADGSILATWPATPFFSCHALAAVGDVDGDGYGDLLIGDPSASATPYAPAALSTGGFQLVSCRLLATMQEKPVQCYQGPFAPELGMTRPRLGNNLVIAGRDSPVGTVGFLAFSSQPAYATNLGVVGCDAWFDPGAGLLLHTSTTVNWQVTIPIPLLPQLAGYRIAIQSFYAPTFSPIGVDLSNGVWGMLGF